MISEKIKEIVKLCAGGGLTITKTINGKTIELSCEPSNIKAFLITQIGNDEKQADVILKSLTPILQKKEAKIEEKIEEKKTKKTKDIISIEEQIEQNLETI